MKNYILLLFSLVALSSCKKEIQGCTDSSATNYNSTATVNNNSCTYEGTALFWHNSNVGANTTVYIGGKNEIISSYYATYNPDCGAAGCATFKLAPGEYSFNATSTAGTWNGTITIAKNDCSKMLLSK